MMRRLRSYKTQEDAAHHQCHLDLQLETVQGGAK
jgi:hypothetical protein